MKCNNTCYQEQGGIRRRGQQFQRRKDFYNERGKSFNQRNESKGDDQFVPNTVVHKE